MEWVVATVTHHGAPAGAATGAAATKTERIVHPVLLSQPALRGEAKTRANNSSRPVEYLSVISLSCLAFSLHIFTLICSYIQVRSCMWLDSY